MITAELQAELDKLKEDTIRQREEAKAKAAEEANAAIIPIIQQKDELIAGLRKDLESKSAGTVDGESPELFANRIGRECIAYLRNGLGLA